VIGNIWTREYKIHGLPHIHLLLIFPWAQKVTNVDDIDRLVSAELPAIENAESYEIVTKCLLHEPCGLGYPNAHCMVDGMCKKRYPREYSEATTQGEDGYALYRRRNDGRTFQKNLGGFVFDNRWVVPHNPYLTRKFNAHINVEVSTGIKSVKYLFKYVYKGQDRAAVQVDGPTNEIKQYIDARYLSATEAIDFLLSFKKHTKWPLVTRLVVHLPGQHNVVFNEDDDLEAVAQRAANQQTTLTRYFLYNAANEGSRHVLYTDFPQQHVWKAREKRWAPCQRGTEAVGRMYFVPAVSGECFYLRLLLTVRLGATSFENLRTVDGIHHPTFQAMCGALGLLQDDQKWDACLREACIDHDVARLRKLFVILLLFCAPLRPEVLWERYRDEMSHDTWYRRRGEGGTLDDAYNDSLLLLEGRLAMANKSLRDFPAMAPVGIKRVNPLIEAELDYDREALRAHVERSLPLLNRDQDRAVASILNVVRLDQGDVFFLDGPGGSGKTFVYSVLLAFVRNEGHVALAVASSIAALLLQGGRTSHSAFKIPINVHRDSLCNVNTSSDTAELIRAAKLIVWDEAPAQHRHCAKAVNRTFRNVLQHAESPFGGKVIVFGGNFRQCPLVVARGSRPAIVGAALKRSVLWRHVEVLALTENMRLRDDLAS
jgi:hypothetical protein